MLETLRVQCQQLDWLKDGGQFIPYPASWLRAARWEDEPVGIPLMSDKTVGTLAAAAVILKGTA